MLLLVLVLEKEAIEDEDEDEFETLQLQAAKQFVEGQLNANVKFAEVGVGRAYFIEAHLIDDRFDLEGIAREKRHAPFRIVEPGGSGDQLLHLSSVLSPDSAVAEH